MNHVSRWFTNQRDRVATCIHRMRERRLIDAAARGAAYRFGAMGVTVVVMWWQTRH
jgi:hypothetical protein